jgi:hypothetical protein
MALLSAVINADGTVVRGAGVTSASRAGPGNYEVIFNRNVSDCTWQGTIAGPGAGTTAIGLIAINLLAASPNGLFVRTADTSNTVTDHQFQLIVFCAR